MHKCFIALFQKLADFHYSIQRVRINCIVLFLVSFKLITVTLRNQIVIQGLEKKSKAHVFMLFEWVLKRNFTCWEMLRVRDMLLPLFSFYKKQN